jgi:hypothetical protein
MNGDVAGGPAEAAPGEKRPAGGAAAAGSVSLIEERLELLWFASSKKKRGVDTAIPGYRPISYPKARGV